VNGGTPAVPRLALAVVLEQALCAVIACLLPACDGGPIPVGERERGLGSEGGGSTAAPLQQRCADPAALRVQDAECWPTRHVGRWHGFVTGDARYWSSGPQPLGYPSDDVLLEIDAAGSGSVRFSPGDAGASAARASDAGAELDAPSPRLVAGFSYALAGLRMSGSPSQDRRQDPRVEFSLRIAEPWSAFCADVAVDAGPCACSAEGCGVSGQSLQGSLLLSQDGRALRGSARSGGTSEELTAGWEFVRE
jgi:hypothetical protein